MPHPNFPCCMNNNGWLPETIYINCRKCLEPKNVEIKGCWVVMLGLRCRILGFFHIFQHCMKVRFRGFPSQTLSRLMYGSTFAMTVVWLKVLEYHLHDSWLIQRTKLIYHCDLWPTRWNQLVWWYNLACPATVQHYVTEHRQECTLFKKANFTNKYCRRTKRKATSRICAILQQNPVQKTITGRLNGLSTYLEFRFHPNIYYMESSTG